MNRILQVDFFRGLFLILITTNHFFSNKNIIYYFTYEFIGWITAAEGFVFLSGLTAGIVYSRKLVEKGEAFISLAAKKRAWTIYKYYLIIFILVTLILFSHSVFREYWSLEPQEYKQLYQSPILSLLLGTIFLYQPIYLDILPMYAIYLLLLPPALRYFQKGQAGVVMAFSFLVYLIGTFNLLPKIYNQFEFMDKVDTGFFNLLSWQFLFISGLYLGYLTYQNKISRMLQNKQLFYSALVLFILLFLFKKVHFRIDTSFLDLHYLVSKENLGPLRLLNFSALLIVFSYFASRCPKWFSFKPINYLGKYSLEVFSMHILLIIIFKPLNEFTNNFNAIKITNSLYFYPWATLMLFFILIPALFLAPIIKNYLNNKSNIKPVTL